MRKSGGMLWWWKDRNYDGLGALVKRGRSLYRKVMCVDAGERWGLAWAAGEGEWRWVTMRRPKGRRAKVMPCLAGVYQEDTTASDVTLILVHGPGRVRMAVR